MLTVFEVTQNADVEGRSSKVVVRTTDRALASRVASSGYGNQSVSSMSGTPSLGTIRELKVAEDADDFVASLNLSAEAEDDLWELLGFPEKAGRKDAAIRRAKAKLTPQELRLLGLDEGSAG